MKFDSLEEGVAFYRNYAKVCGFTTRMSSVKKVMMELYYLNIAYVVRKASKKLQKLLQKVIEIEHLLELDVKPELHLGFVRRVAIRYLLFIKVIHMFYLLQHRCIMSNNLEI
ncbi:Protein FAR1-RELATED SEQUENCE 1 [Bienertia sinuspersici]